MHDKFKRRMQSSKGTDRLRQQIAVEAARRMLETLGPVPDDPSGRIGEATESEYYTAKRKAAAVLGHRIPAGGSPVRFRNPRREVCTLSRSRRNVDEPDDPQPEPTGPLPTLADHLDRFALYRLRLAPLESVKQNPRLTPRATHSTMRAPGIRAGA